MIEGMESKIKKQLLHALRNEPHFFNTRTFSKLLLVYSFGITMNSEGLRSDKRFHCRESVALSRFWKRANIMTKLSRSIKTKF